MIDIKIGQTITGSFSNSDPSFPNSSNTIYYYDDYNLKDISSFQQEKFTIKRSVLDGSLGIALVNADTNTVIYGYQNSDVPNRNDIATSTTTFSAGDTSLSDLESLFPGINYKIRVFSSHPGDYEVALLDEGKGTSIVSNDLSNYVGSVGANGDISPLVFSNNAATTSDSGLVSLDSNYPNDNPGNDIFTDIALGSNKLYAIGKSGGFDNLYQLDPGVPIGQQVKQLGIIKDNLGNNLTGELNALDFSDSDILYAIGLNKFYQIDPTTRTAKLLATLPQSFTSSGDITYDKASNRFLATSVDSYATDSLWQIPLDNPAQATKIGQIGFNNVYGINFENSELIGFSNPDYFSNSAERIKISLTTGQGTFDQNIKTRTGSSPTNYIINGSSRIPTVEVTQPDVRPTTPDEKDAIYEFLSKDVAYKADLQERTNYLETKNYVETKNYLEKFYQNADFKQLVGDYEVDKIFNDSTTGFFAVGLTSNTKAPVLVIRGTEPKSDYGADIFSDLNGKEIGLNQYEKNSSALLAWLASVQTNTSKNPKGFAPDITGHSLGGALAQQLASDATYTGQVLGSKDTHVAQTLGDIITFNSPGIAATNVSNFNPGKVNRVKHYLVSGDVVSLGGEKFLPGSYEILDFDDPNVGNNHLLPVLTPKVSYGSSDNTQVLQKKSDVKIIDENKNNDDLLNSYFFTYFDPEYLPFLAKAETATQIIPIPGLAALGIIPPLLLFRGTVETSRQVIGYGIDKLTAAIKTTDYVLNGDIPVALPNTEFDINGLKIKSESLSARKNGLKSLALQGKVSLSGIFGATADFAGDNYIKVSNTGLDVVGSLSLQDINLGSWSIRNAELKSNTVSKNFSGTANILFPGGGIVAGSFDVLNGKVNSIDVNADNVNISTALTKLSLEHISGKIENLADPKTFEFNGAINITNSIAGNQIWSLDAKGKIDKDRLTGEGELSILDGRAKGRAKGSLDWNQRLFAASADLSILNGFITTIVRTPFEKKNGRGRQKKQFIA
jgi:Lipase (class 3)